MKKHFLYDPTAEYLTPPLQGKSLVIFDSATGAEQLTAAEFEQRALKKRNDATKKSNELDGWRPKNVCANSKPNLND